MEDFINKVQETSREGLKRQIDKFERTATGGLLSGLLFYITKVPANDYVMKDISYEEFDTIRGYEPMIYTSSYELYRKRFLEEELRQKELNSKDHFAVHKVAVCWEDVNEKVLKIEAREDFYGWDLSELGVFVN